MGHDKHLCNKVESQSTMSDYKELARNRKSIRMRAAQVATAPSTLAVSAEAYVGPFALVFDVVHGNSVRQDRVGIEV